MKANSQQERLNYLDSVRAFALLLGIVFHASLSFAPFYFGWAVMDISTSPVISGFMLISHSFRMELFFLIAGFFSCMTLHKSGMTVFIRSRWVRLGIPFVVGWFVLRPLLVSAWVMGADSLQGDVDILRGLQLGLQSLQQLPNGLFTGSHLWFLYYLMLTTGIWLLLRAVLNRISRNHATFLARLNKLAANLIASRFALPWLAFPTALCLLFMNAWGMDTPDQSLVPHVPVLCVYSGFFVFGWWLQGRKAVLENFTRITPGRVALCCISIGASMVLSREQPGGFHSPITLTKSAFVVAYALMMWSLVALSIGVFKNFLNRPNALVRYIADASYWLYLIHLPIVIWLQIACAELPLHWSVKLVIITTSSIAISLLLYDVFVRGTLIGKVLNGRRKGGWIVRWINNKPQQSNETYY